VKVVYPLHKHRVDSRGRTPREPQLRSAVSIEMPWLCSIPRGLFWGLRPIFGSPNFEKKFPLFWGYPWNPEGGSLEIILFHDRVTSSTSKIVKALIASSSTIEDLLFPHKISRMNSCSSVLNNLIPCHPSDVSCLPCRLRVNGHCNFEIFVLGKLVFETSLNDLNSFKIIK